MKQVSQFYLEGIKEGRISLETQGVETFTIQERLDNLDSTIKGFDASSPVGQMLRGERDFWRNQLKIQQASKNAAEARYLRALADALPGMLRTEVVVRGIAYRVLPWVSRSYFGEEGTKRPTKG